MSPLTRIAKSGRAGFSIRAYVVAVVLAMMAPTLMITWWVTSSSAASERRQLEQNAEAETREIAAAVDREIIGVQHMMTVLAGSVLLQQGDLEAFHQQAGQVATMLDTTIMLRDVQLGQQIVNTAFPWGTSLADQKPPPRAEFEHELLRAGKVAASNVFFGPLTRRPVVRISVPVVRNGSVDFLLSIAVPLQRFGEVLASLQLGPGQIATVIDREGIIVARSTRHDEFAGTRLATYPVEWNSLNRSSNREGIPFHWFNRRSDVAGWMVSVGVPDSVLNEPSRRALANFTAAGGLAFLITLALSYPLANRLAAFSGALGIDRTPTGEEFQVLFESAPNGVLVVDHTGRIMLMNARMETQFGYRRDELIGQPVETLIPERLRQGHASLRQSFMRAAEARPMGADRDLYGLRKDGTEFPIEIDLNPISTPAGALVMATVVDITARKRAAERLSLALGERDELRRRFLQAQEEERLRLARELHDQTGQGLTAVMLELKGIESHIGEADRDRVRQLRRQLEKLGQTLHHVAWELRPASIDELGLASAIANYVSEWSTQYRIEADFHCGDRKLDALSDEVRTAIYRVVQEGLTNIAKHARGATAVSVVIERLEALVRVIIEDDGCGFDTASLQDAPRHRGLGLAGMRERLSLIGGALEIESSIGGGTTIFASIPITSERMAA